MDSRTQKQPDQRLRRCVSVYQRTGDSLVSEYVLSGFDPASFSSQFSLDISDDPEMVAVYPIRHEHVGYFSRILPSTVVFDFERFEYFVETYADTDHAA